MNNITLIVVYLLLLYPWIALIERKDEGIRVSGVSCGFLQNHYNIKLCYGKQKINIPLARIAGVTTLSSLSETNKINITYLARKP